MGVINDEFKNKLDIHSQHYGLFFKYKEDIEALESLHTMAVKNQIITGIEWNHNEIANVPEGTRLKINEAIKRVLQDAITEKVSQLKPYVEDEEV